MGDSQALPAGPPVGRRPLPQAPQPSAPNRSAGGASGRAAWRASCPTPRPESTDKWHAMNVSKPSESSVRKSASKREKPVITVLDARPMDQVGFRGVEGASPNPALQKEVQEEPVKMRPPPPTRPASSFRRSMPINMEKVGLSLGDEDHLSRDKPLPPRPNQKLVTAASACYTSEALNNKNTAHGPQNCNSGETTSIGESVSNAETKRVPDLIAGQQVSAPQRTVDLLIDVPPSTQAPRSPPQRVLAGKRPLPANRGPPPPLPKKSPSVPNLLTMNGDMSWSVLKPVHITSQDDSGFGPESSPPSPAPRVPKTPTIIRVHKPTDSNRKAGPEAEMKGGKEQNKEQTGTDAAHVSLPNDPESSKSGKVAGGVRVFPFAIPKSKLDSPKPEDSSSDVTDGRKSKPPPMVKPKPALLPKPSLRPKPTTAPKPTNRPQSAAFASSLKFAQSLETSSKPSHEVSPRRVREVERGGEHSAISAKEINQPKESIAKERDGEHRNLAGHEFIEQKSIRSDLFAHDHVPKKGPMKAIYRPTIIRAAVKTKEADPVPQEPAQEFTPVNKRLSASCLNMSTSSGSSLSAVEFNNNEWNSPSSEPTAWDDQFRTTPQPARRQRPTIIRPTSTVVSASKDTEQAEFQKSGAGKSVSFAGADTEPSPPSTRPRAFSGGILKSALSMPDISGKKRGAPPARPSAPPSRPGSRTSSIFENGTPPMSPVSPVRRSSNTTPPDSPASSKKAPPPRPSEGPKRPPRPAEGPRRRSSSSSSGGGTSTPKAEARRSTSGSPDLPSRPGPGHPLYHYVAQGPHAVALFDYQAQHEDELSFKVGDVIELIRQNNADWLLGRSGHGEGIFPVSFVDVIEPLPDNLVNLEPKKSRERVEEARPTSDGGSGPRCRARFDYESKQPEDLHFLAGDVITLLEHVGDDWLRGELRGSVGIFPLSFVEIIEDVEEEKETETAPPLPSSPIPQSKPALPSWDDEPVEKDIHIGTALHDFSGETGELSFQAGARIHVISRVNEDWLYGTLGTSQGSFPANFIDTVPLDLPQYEEPTPHSGVEARSEPSRTECAPNLPPSEANASLGFCVARFAFPGESEADLALEVGDKVEILEHLSEDWLRGRVGTRQGEFPLAFVEILPGHNQSISEAHSVSGRDTQPDIQPNTQPGGTEATVLHDFPGDTEGDLSLRRGEKVLVTGRVGDDWLSGRIGDREGIFPANFVDVEA